MWWDHGVGWTGWMWMTLAMVAFWGLVVWAVMALFRSGGTTITAQPRERSPEQILDERFAHGEIDAEEYATRSGLLRHAR